MLVLTRCAAPVYLKLNYFVRERKWRNRSRNDCWMLRHNTSPGCPPRALPKHEYMAELFANSDSPQRRLSSRLEPSSREFRLADKLGVVSDYVVALTFFRSLYTFRLTFLRMHDEFKIINVQRNYNVVLV